MTDIFISHAVADKDFVEKFVLFLKEAIGVKETAIFCSSVSGHDIPLGADFNAYMKRQIQSPKLVICIITDKYLESNFCLMELGAAWAQSAKTLPVVTSSDKYDFVKNTLGLIQAMNITNHDKLIDLRELIKSIDIELEDRGEHTWEKKRKKWKASLPRTLKKLSTSSKIDREKFDSVISELSSAREDIATLESELNDAEEKIEALEDCKDADDVRDVKRQFGDTGQQEQFDSLISDVKETFPDYASKPVRKHILMDYRSRSGIIEWGAYREAFEQAVQYNLIDPEDDSVNWGNKKLTKLNKKLDALSEFLEDSENSKFIEAKEDDEICMDIDSMEFFEDHSII